MNGEVRGDFFSAGPLGQFRQPQGRAHEAGVPDCPVVSQSRGGVTLHAQPAHERAVCLLIELVLPDQSERGQTRLVPVPALLRHALRIPEREPGDDAATSTLAVQPPVEPFRPEVHQLGGEVTAVEVDHRLVILGLEGSLELVQFVHDPVWHQPDGVRVHGQQQTHVRANVVERLTQGMACPAVVALPEEVGEFIPHVDGSGVRHQVEEQTRVLARPQRDRASSRVQGRDFPEAAQCQHVFPSPSGWRATDFGWRTEPS